MFISKSEKESLVETALNLGEKLMKLEYELHTLKALMKKSPSWKWVENLDNRIVKLESKPVIKVSSPLSVIKEAPLIEKKAPITASIVVKRKVGRPLGSKAKRPKFPPKTPFELLKPLGRPKGSKNKPK